MARVKESDVINTSPTHPGQHVRDSVLTPKKLSVLAAAKLVGVGRPAFSNFINGRAATTPDMAARIEVVFGIPAQHLLDMQAAYDAAAAKAKGTPANALPYVVPFLGIKATDIEVWVERNIPARIRLAVFLRTLVNSTSNDITKIDFPGNDDAQRPGWDGYIEIEQATPWIPLGISGWEFGTDKDIKGKADKDFAKSVKATTKADRDQTTFVFVTPRHWSGKADWVKEKKSKRQWKDVRAYDSSDLEQWLEQSIAAQVWFSNETPRSSANDVRSLDKCWADWANATNPPLVDSLFAPAIASAKQAMFSRVSKQAEGPTIIAADSIEEALAFLAQLFSPAGDELEMYRDRVLVFDKAGVLPKLAEGTKNFIAVAASQDVERELGPLSNLMHTIVVYPRNVANASPHVVLEPLNYETFRSSLEEMKYGSDDVARYSKESGRSLTVLRRRLTKVPAIRTPQWAADHETATNLVPFLFIGAWNSANSADQKILSQLSNADSYEKVEKQCQHLTGLNDPPMWSIGTYRGVVSKIDLLFAIAGSVTKPDLERYFDIAKIVLGEDDPKLDLPDGQRWAASWQGKSREFSAAIREGIAETLVLLSVHGNNLFKTRLGFDCEYEAAQLVKELLSPLKTRILEANDRDLIAYAEAAPDTFLSILEEDLKSPSPETFGLLRPVGTGVFDGCPRTGLLWALEGLAWSTTTLHRSALILARLAEIEINDNWSNKPTNSLQAIFCVWMPQTAADHNIRLRVLKLVAAKFPEVAWKVCIEELDTNSRLGHYSHKPRWRNDGYGLGEPFKTRGPIRAFILEIIDMVLNWKGGHTREMLCDLVQRLHDFPEENQARVWDLIKAWANTNATDLDKAFVREKIRVTVLSRRGVKRSKKANDTNLSAIAKEAYQALEPSDLLNRHEWLFREHWLEESADEIHDDDFDFKKREARITKLRTQALREIFDARGLSGILEFIEMGKAAGQIGWHMATELLRETDIPDLLLAALPFTLDNQSWAKKSLIIGTLSAVFDEKKRVNILLKVKKKTSETEFARLLLLAPFRRSTWQMVDELDEQHRHTYWNEIAPDWINDEDGNANEAIERLLLAQRPRAAFACVRFKLEAVPPELLFRLLSDIVKSGKDQPGHYQLEQYYVEQAFTILNKSSGLTLEQKAGLEFAYIGILSKPWSEKEGYGIPNLEKYIEEHPDLFVRAIVWTYKRKDEGEDPPDWKVEPEQVENLAERGYKLLEALSRIPGHDEDSEERRTSRLTAWIKKVREACAELGRLDVADSSIGNLLSGAPNGKDDVWPCEPVRDVLEEIHSKKMMSGARTGLYNARGVVHRIQGGEQERRLADKYRAWMNALQYSHPFVASELLMGMVKTYEYEASREDTEAGIRKRLP